MDAISCIWRAQDGKQVAKLHHPNEPDSGIAITHSWKGSIVESLVFSHDGKLLASNDGYGEIKSGTSPPPSNAA